MIRLVDNDHILSPDHYTWHPICSCKDVAQEFNYNLGTAIAYIWRVGRKDDPIQDIDKAIRHLEFERDRLMASAQPSVAAPVASPEHYDDDKYEP